MTAPDLLAAVYAYHHGEPYDPGKLRAYWKQCNDKRPHRAQDRCMICEQPATDRVCEAHRYYRTPCRYCGGKIQRKAGATRPPSLCLTCRAEGRYVRHGRVVTRRSARG